MAHVEVGQQAPAFRLPAGQGGEIGLADYRGRSNVVVWFTKGMACPFCRTQMSQFARGLGRLSAGFAALYAFGRPSIPRHPHGHRLRAPQTAELVPERVNAGRMRASSACSGSDRCHRFSGAC